MLELREHAVEKRKWGILVQCDPISKLSIREEANGFLFVLDSIFSTFGLHPTSENLF